MRLLFLAALAVAAWLVLRRRRKGRARVVVGWTDGSELELSTGPEREELLSVARRAFA